MIKYLSRRIIISFFTIFLVVTISFILLHAVPGSPLQNTQILSKDMEERLSNYYGLDKPIYEQFIVYLKNIFCFNFGYSYTNIGQSVNTIIKKTFPISAFLGIQAYLFSFPLGIIFGVISAHKKGKKIDNVFNVYSALFASMPLFVVCTLMQYIFSVKLKIFPSGLWKGYVYTILPSISLSLVLIASKTRQMRSVMLEIINENYLVTARIKNLPKMYRFLHYEVRNAIIPMLSSLGVELASILMGSIVVEQIFSIPGIGAFYIKAIQNLDYSVVLGITIFYTMLVITFNLITDILYSIIDPRIRLEK